MDAVLDTNVIVSAVISPRGAPAQVYRAWRDGRFAYVTSAPLLDELTRVLTYARLQRYISWDAEERAEFLEAVGYAATLVTPKIRLQVIDEHPDDNRVLEAAVEGSAACIVTGDAHLLDLGSYEGIEIVRPARFLALLSVEGG